MATVPTKYGLFMEHVYLQPGVPDGLANTSRSQGEGGDTAPPPEDEGPKDRDHGLNMKATIGKMGKGNDATFDKFVYEADPYVDPVRRRLQAVAESRKKNVTEMPFKTISPMKKSATPGDYHGTSGKVPHLPADVINTKKKGDFPQQARGIFTSPAKKGTFGYNKTTVSEHAGPKGVATEYEYQHDPETLAIRRRREAAEADRKARVSELPFKPANPAKKGGFGVPNTTISKGKGVAGEWEYVIPTVDPKPEGDEEKKDTTPFRPTNKFASQRIEKIEYIHDPEVPKLQKEAATKKAERERLQSTGPWKPNIAYKTDMVRSIVRMNLR